MTKTLVLSIALLACNTQRDPGSEPAPPSSTPPAPTTTPTPAPTPAPAKPSVVAKVDPVENEVFAVATRWNDALAKRDANALSQVYAKKVRLYTTEVTREAAIKTKATALASAKDYTQSIRFVEIDTRKKDAPRAEFNKHWTANGKESAVRGSLTFAKEDGKWVIKDESDAPSDQRRQRAAASVDSCESLVQMLVSSTPEAQALLTGPTDPKRGHNTNGTRLGGGPPEQATYSVAVHENHDDHLTTLAWFDVDPKTGKVTSTIDDKPTTGSEALVDKVKAACK